MNSGTARDSVLILTYSASSSQKHVDPKLATFPVRESIFNYLVYVFRRALE